MDEFKTAKQMMKDYDLPYTKLEKKTFENIQKIIKNGDRLSLTEWKDLLQTHDLAVYAALLSYEVIPDKIKIEAINNATADSRAEKQLFLPIIFSKDEEILSYMTREVSEELVNAIDINNAIKKTNLYLTMTNEKWLPFSGSHVEELMLQKIIDGKELDSIRKTTYDTYQMIELCTDTSMLEDIIGNYEDKHEYVRTAIMNNLYVPMSTREKMYNLGADFTLIKTQQTSDVIQNLYRASIDGLKKDAVSDYGAQQSLACMQHLIRYDLMFESCNIDFFNRYIAGELNDKIVDDLVIKVISQTHSPDIIEEAMRNRKARIASTAIRNRDALPEMKIEKLEEILQQASKAVFPGVFSTGKKEIALAIVETTTLPVNKYSTVISYFGDEKYMAKEAIVMSPYTPKEVLEKIAQDNTEKTWLRVCAYILSERNDGLSAYDAKKMADTIKMITIKQTKDSMGFFVLPQFQFMPDKNTMPCKELQELLKKITNKNGDDRIIKVAKKVAKEYNDAIEKKSAYMLAKQSIGLLDISKMSISDLMLEREVILDDIFGKPETLKLSIDEKLIDKKDFSSPTNFYEVFSIVEKMVHHAERYKNVSRRLEELIKEEASERFMKIFLQKEER